MKKFTNKNVQKEKNLIVRNIIIFFAIIVVAFAFKMWEKQINEKVNSEATDLNTLIMAGEENWDKKAYLNINAIPYQFATADGIDESYYIVTDGEYLYIVYMSNSDFDKLNKEEIEQTPIKVEGITTQIPEEIKQIAIEAYNENMEEEYKIKTDEDFYSYFGNIYLDMSLSENSSAIMAKYIFILLLVIGGIGFICVLYKYVTFDKNVEKMDNDVINSLDEEMNNPDAFYYEKMHMYLTENYIITFSGKMTAINYKDIVWMYVYEQRTNGFKTSKAIKVMTNEGKTYTIAVTPGITKAQKEVYDEVWNTILSKNGNITVGYTKENIKEIKEKYKK